MEIDKQRATLLLLACTLLLLLFSGSIVLAYGQQTSGAPTASANSGPPPNHYRQRDDQQWRGRYRRPMGARFHGQFRGRGSMGGPFMRLGPPGRWWRNPDLATKLGLTPDQQKRMDDIFQQSRLSLIDLVAAVKKQELIMQPLLNADQPDETKIIAQIDRVAQARADLEKSNARMLLGLRRVLTPDQWKKLQDMRWQRDGFGGGPGGPGGWRGDGDGNGNGPPPPGF